MKKIFCFGDGYAAGHIWPEWPQILAVLAPQHSVIVTAGIGAGSEFLVSGFVDQLEHIRDNTVIFQWPLAERFDKLLQDNSWQQTIASDPIYNFNVNVDTCGRSWWLTSASQTSEVRQYHAQYVQHQQHIHRQNIYKTLVSQTASNIKAKIIHTSTFDQELFSLNPRWHAVRQTQIQPSPVVHFYWLIEEILPQIDIEIDQDLQQQLEELINQTQWTAYDPDRQEIWLNIAQQIGQSHL